jgi:uncharacterized RDD family membrane protein YckC
LEGEAACTLCGAALSGGGTPAGAAAWSAAPAAAAAVPAVAYGGFWRRFAGLLIDSCVLFFPVSTLRVVLGLEPLAAFDPFTPAAWTAALAEVMLGWLYSASLISSAARGTLGQQVMDLRVTDLQGRRVSFLRASWRYWAQALTLFTLGVGYLVQLATPRRQAIHDLVSGSLVVRPPRASRPVLAPVTGSPA